MPPTSPVTPGFRCVAVVFARTVVDGEDRGIKPFVLQLHDGQFMTPGVAIKYVSQGRQLLDVSYFIQSLAATRWVTTS
jgi:acyl-CoA oxidase